MRLRVLLPARVLVDEAVTSVSAEAVDGAFTLRPRHLDWVAPLARGLLTYVGTGGARTVVAVNRGILVKVGEDVLVSTREAISGPDLAALDRSIADVFRATDAEEQAGRAALARMGTDVVQRLVELEELQESGS